MNEINNIVEELSCIRQEFEKLNKTLSEIKDLLTPTNLTVSQEYIDEEVKKIAYAKPQNKIKFDEFDEKEYSADDWRNR